MTAILISLNVSDAKDTSIVVYNGGFSLVGEKIDLDLKKGTQILNYANVTSHLETDSVILRDPKEKSQFQIIEQSYRADTASQGLLLSLFEGKTIDFLIGEKGSEKKSKGKIIRSGYLAAGGQSEPLVEMDGQLRFGLPGTPLFPSLNDDAILKPTLVWKIDSRQSEKCEADLSYMTSGMSWEATYNFVAAEKGNDLDLVGWMSIQNQTGKTFDQAKIKLMAGDVNKIQNNVAPQMMMRGMAMDMMEAKQTVKEKSFDEFHLYTVAAPTTLRDRENKQIEFVRAVGIKSEPVYVYNGAYIDQNRYGGWGYENIRQDQGYGTESNPKVWVMREFKNSKENKMGFALPKGKVKFYRRDDDGRLAFTGENMLDHTPENEWIKLYTGNSFDLVGERVRTDYRTDQNQRWVDETFEIKLRNQKKVDANIKVVENLYRWTNWKITKSSLPYKKNNSQSIAFDVNVPAQKEKVLTYTVHYSW